MNLQEQKLTTEFVDWQAALLDSNWIASALGGGAQRRVIGGIWRYESSVDRPLKLHFCLVPRLGDAPQCY